VRAHHHTKNTVWMTKNSLGHVVKINRIPTRPLLGASHLHFASTHLHSRHLNTMSSTADAIQAKLFSREPPVLEPGTKVWDKALVDQIAGLKEHRFVKAGMPSPVLPTAYPPPPVKAGITAPCLAPQATMCLYSAVLPYDIIRC